MINIEKINNIINKLIDLANDLKDLSNDEILYIKTVTEIKIRLDELNRIEKRWEDWIE